jgi:hypothetical protein
MTDRPDRKRPFGVAAVTILLLLLAAVIGLEVRRDRLDVPWQFPAQVPRAATIRMLGYTLAAVLVLLAAGMWRLRRAAWVGTMLLVGVLMAIELFWYARGEPRYHIMALCIFIVFYLNQGQVQRLFRGGAEGTE